MTRLPKGSWSQSIVGNETSKQVRQRVVECRSRQLQRQGKANAHLTSAELRSYCGLATDDADFLELAVEKLGLSTRAHHKILKISRTIADMEAKQHIEKSHLIEALSYRAMDRLLRHLSDAVHS